MKHLWLGNPAQLTKETNSWTHPCWCQSLLPRAGMAETQGKSRQRMFSSPKSGPTNKWAADGWASFLCLLHDLVSTCKFSLTHWRTMSQRCWKILGIWMLRTYTVSCFLSSNGYEKSSLQNPLSRKNGYFISCGKTPLPSNTGTVWGWVTRNWLTCWGTGHTRGRTSTCSLSHRLTRVRGLWWWSAQGVCAHLAPDALLRGDLLALGQSPQRPAERSSRWKPWYSWRGKDRGITRLRGLVNNK